MCFLDHLNPLRHVFFQHQIEFKEVLSDQFLSSIPEQIFGLFVAVDKAAFKIAQIVSFRGIFKKPPEAFFAFDQRPPVLGEGIGHIVKRPGQGEKLAGGRRKRAAGLEIPPRISAGEFHQASNGGEQGFLRNEHCDKQGQHGRGHQQQQIALQGCVGRRQNIGLGDAGPHIHVRGVFGLEAHRLEGKYAPNPVGAAARKDARLAGPVGFFPGILFYRLADGIGVFTRWIIKKADPLVIRHGDKGLFRQIGDVVKVGEIGQPDGRRQHAPELLVRAVDRVGERKGRRPRAGPGHDVFAHGKGFPFHCRAHMFTVGEIGDPQGSAGDLHDALPIRQGDIEVIGVLFEHRPQNLPALLPVQALNLRQERQGRQHLPDGAAEFLLGFRHGMGQQQRILPGLFDSAPALLQPGIQDDRQGRHDRQQHDDQEISANGTHSEHGDPMMMDGQ